MFHWVKSKLNYSLGKMVPIDFVIKRLKIRPTGLLIELTNICNANCIYCGYRFMKRKKGIMSWEVFKKLIDDFDDIGGGDINLTGIVGDPLVDSDIVEKIIYSKSKRNIRNIRFSTNGILLDKVGIKKLLRSGVNSILINIGGMDEDTYKILFGVDAFHKVYKNIQEILSINKSMGGEIHIIVVIKYISLTDILNNKNYLQLKTSGARIIFDNTYDSWCGRILRDNMIGEMKLKSNQKKKEPCSSLYTTLSIMWNGYVVPCCRALDGEIIVGNIVEQSISDIWESNTLKNLRKSFIERDIPTICEKCELYEGLKPIKSLHLFKRVWRFKRRKSMLSSK